MARELEEGDLVLCTVEKIMGTIVFAKIHYPGEERSGSLIFSEIAPGRIRNIRNYVVPKKKIVCKVLRLKEDQIHLSLRRVSQEERKEVMNKYKLEKSYTGIIKNLLNDDEKAKKIMQEIEDSEGIYEFVEEAKENPEKLEKFFDKETSEKILEKINEQKKKVSIIKKEFGLSSTSGNGMEKIKLLLREIEEKNKEISIRYISAGKYSLKAEAEEEIKKLDQKVKTILSEIESKSKEQGLKFEFKDKSKK